jgi:hypothetical protein
MPVIPVEILPILEHLGIIDPTISRWERREPWPGRYVRAHYFCPCGSRPDGQQKVELKHTWLAGRRPHAYSTQALNSPAGKAA